MNDYCLGLKPARPDAIQLKLSEFADLDALPQPPLRFGHGLDLVYGMLANNRVGCCVISGGMHEEQAWGTVIGKVPPFTASNAIHEYSAITGYNPYDPRTDQGTDMQVAASYRRRTGLLDALGNRNKIDAYLQIDPSNVGHLITAAYTFEAVALGVYITRAATLQFDQGQPWTVVPGSPVRGAHYVPMIGRNSHGLPLIVTWGRLHAVTNEWLAHYTEQAVVYIKSAIVGPKNLSPEGFRLADLQRVITQL